MATIQLFFILLLAAVTSASPPFQWVKHELASPDTAHMLTFWLTSRNGDGALFETVDGVSFPASPNFRKYSTHETLKSLVAAKDEHISDVKAWLQTAGVKQITEGKHGDYLFATGNVSTWSRIFSKKFAWYKNERSDKRVLRLEHLPSVRDASIHVGDRFAHSIRAIFGLSDFYPLFSTRARPLDDKCNQFKGAQVDPKVIAQTYGTEYAPSFAHDVPSQGVAAFEDAQFIPSDVKQFQTDYNLSFVNISVLGPNNGGYYGEASLDTQYIFATGKGIPTWFIAREGFDMLQWSFLVMNMTKPPSVLSISWGNGESGFDLSHMKAASREFAKLGALGISLFAASGDDGTGKQGFWTCKKFDPTWPASSPYVTAVGGTYLDSSEEVGWSSSGGGFSDVFPSPSYQRAAIKKYLSSAVPMPSATLYNSSGRATPDVSALSTNYRTLALGAYGCISGTSAATPVFAGLVSTINAELAKAGKQPVGFINPALYAGGTSVGFDVVKGNNKVSGCPSGFSAAPHFDCVTGLGTPLYGTMRQILMQH